jgi:PAS domain S-box-containing protein
MSEVLIKDRRARDLLKTGALQNAILSTTGFASIAIDERGVVQIFNAGAKRMLGYTGAEVVNKLTPADFSDPAELIERAAALSREFATTVAPGFEALVFKASRDIEDQYDVTCIRKDGSRFPATVFVAALHDPKGVIIGYLLTAIDNAAGTTKPASDEPKVALQPQAAGGAARRGVLYVEDRPESVRLVEQIVARRTDVLLLCAANVNLGIELARAERPEVICMNIDVPGISPIQLMQLLRADPATRDAPILALSANVAPGAVAKALEAGFFHCLTRPMEAEPFMEALGDALEFAAIERAEQNDLPKRAAHSH